MARLAPILLMSLLLGGCGGEGSSPTKAGTTYGTPVDVTNAVPAPAVAAEESLYVDRALAIDGRIKAVRADGCTMVLATGAAPLVVTAARTDAGNCAWQVPNGVQSFAVATGTLRVAADTLRLPANGVRVTPVRIFSPDS